MLEWVVRVYLANLPVNMSVHIAKHYYKQQDLSDEQHELGRQQNMRTFTHLN